MSTPDVAVLIAVVSAILLAIMAWYRRYTKDRDRARRLQVEGLHLTALVTEAKVLTSGDNSAIVQLQVGFTLPGGVAQDRTIQQTLNLASIPHRGDQVPIYVNPHDASDLVLAG